MAVYTLSEIYIYPIKSLGGIALQEAQVQERGLQYDRRWMLVNEQNEFLTQRQHAQMALLKVSLKPDGLQVTHKRNEVEPLHIPFEPQKSGEITVSIWDDTCTAVEISDEANVWFTNVLGMPAKLVYMPDTTERLVDPKYAFEQEVVGFADAYPFLIIGQASLDDLNSRLESKSSINRFRPNFVFTGGEAFEEDTWDTFTINRISFRAAKPCARCVVTTIDQETGDKYPESLRVMAGYRTKNNKVMFGQNLVHIGSGNVSVGDELQVQTRKG